MRIIQLDQFRKEIMEFPVETREDIFSLISRFAQGGTMSRKEFKTFAIDRQTKIQEFRVKDHRGNWRAISTIIRNGDLVLVHAFHKKSQELQGREKETIRLRIRRIKP